MRPLILYAAETFTMTKRVADKLRDIEWKVIMIIFEIKQEMKSEDIVTKIQQIDMAWTFS